MSGLDKMKAQIIAEAQENAKEILAQAHAQADSIIGEAKAQAEKDARKIVAQAEEAGVKDKDIVSIKIEGERGLVFNNVLVRSGDAHEREVHLDTDEGNAAGCGPDAVCTIIK